jgi:hypothetical protein
MASKLADLQDERLLDCISFPPPIPAELIEKLNIGGTLLQTKMRMEHNRGGETCAVLSGRYPTIFGMQDVIHFRWETGTIRRFF